jgi:hypothetical protein
MEVKKTRDIRFISTQRLMFVASRRTSATSSVQPSIFDMSDRRLIEKNPAVYQNVSPAFISSPATRRPRPGGIAHPTACGLCGGLASIEPSCKATTAQ